MSSDVIHKRQTAYLASGFLPEVEDAYRMKEVNQPGPTLTGAHKDTSCFLQGK